MTRRAAPNGPLHPGARLAAVAVRKPRTVLGVALLVAALSLGWAALRLEVRTSNLDLVDPSRPEVARFLDVAQTFGTPNVLVVVVEVRGSLDGQGPLDRQATQDERAALEAFVDRLGPSLRGAEGVRAVIDRLPAPGGVGALAPIDPYLRSRDGRMAFLFVQPDDPLSRADSIEPFVTAVEDRIRTADPEAAGLTAGLTGMPRYALDDRDVIQRDVGRLSVVSAVLVLALFLGAFRRPRGPLLAMAALVLAVATTVGLVTFVPGHLTLLSAFFASILFGLGVDFGIHLVARWEDADAGSGRSEDPQASLVAAVDALAPSLTTGGLTTAAAFFAMAWSGFRGFEQLGLVAGSGVLVCLLATFGVLPALLVLGGRRGTVAEAAPKRRLATCLRAVQSPGVALAVAALAVLGTVSGAPPFDADYLNLQPEGSETVRLERQMAERSTWSPELAIVVAPDREATVEAVQSLRALPHVAAVRSGLDLEVLEGLGGEVDPALRSMFHSGDGRWAIYVVPDDDIWNPAALDAFLAPIEDLAPDVTGLPVLGRFMVDQSLGAMTRTAQIAAGLLLLFVFVDFRRPLPTLLAVLPAFLTAGSLHGLMRLFGIAYNPLDVLALPIVLGIAVDDGVHMVHRFLQEDGDLGLTLAGAGRAVVLTSATTLAAFGSLLLTSHRGLASFAACLCLGVVSALVLSTLVLPQALRWARPWLVAPKAVQPAKVSPA